MKGIFSRYLDHLYLKHWIIGICRCDIKEIIRTGIFSQEVQWLNLNSIDHYNADPFLLESDDNGFKVLYEDFALDDFYGKIFLSAFDNNCNQVSRKMLLDIKSHISYPFFFREGNKTYVFPESSSAGRLSCYEFDPLNQSLEFRKDILGLALLDSTIIKYNKKYWLFGTLKGSGSNSRLNIFFSDDLLGPYLPHPGNPVKDSVISSRPAGNFIEVDGTIYRPAQNCEKQYGESITINRIDNLDENNFREEQHMVIRIDRKAFNNENIMAMHTLNSTGGLIVIDGIKWTFSPKNQWKYFLKNREYGKKLRLEYGNQ